MIRYFPDVRSGLTGTEEGGAAEPDFDQALQAAVEKTRAARGATDAAEEREPIDPSRDSDDEIRRQVASDDTVVSRNVEDGLEDGTERITEGPYGESRELRENLRAVGIDPDAPLKTSTPRERELEAERDEANAALDWQGAEDARLDFEEAIEESYDVDDYAAHLAELVLGVPESLRQEVAEEALAHLREEHDLDDEDLYAVTGSALNRVRAEYARGVEAEAQMAEAMEQRKLDEIARTGAAGQQAAAMAWALERGIGKTEGEQRILDAHGLALEHGIDMEMLPPEQYRDALVRFDGEHQAMLSARRQHAFKQRLMDEETTSVPDGLSMISPLDGSEIPMSGKRTLPPKRITRADIERHAGKVNRGKGRFSAGESLEIREALKAPDPKAGGRDGWEAMQKIADDLFKAAEPDPRR